MKLTPAGGPTVSPAVTHAVGPAAGDASAPASPTTAVDPDAGLPPGTPITLADALAAADAAPDVVVARSVQNAAEQAIAIVRAPGAPALTVGTNSITARETVAVSAPIPGEASAGAWPRRRPRSGRRGARASSPAPKRGGFCERTGALAAAGALGRLASGAPRESHADRPVSSRPAARAARRFRAAASDRRASGEGLAGSLRPRPSCSIPRSSVDAARPSPLQTAGETPRRRAVAREGNGARRPMLRSSHREAKLAEMEARLTAARRQGWPGLAAEVGADFDDPTQPGTDKHALLTATVPFDSRARSRVAAAERDGAALELERERRLARASAEAAWRRAEGSRRKFETLDAGAPGEEAAGLRPRRIPGGQTDLFRLLEAGGAGRGEASRWEAWRDWGAASSDLMAMTGEEP